MKKFLALFLCLLTMSILGQTADERANTPVPFTLADRDRLIKLEVQVEAMNAKIDDKVEGLNTKIEALNTKIEALNTKIDTEVRALRHEIDSLRREVDSLRSLMYIMIAGIFGLIGFTVWDRRTFHLKLEKRVESLERRSVIYSPKQTIS